MSSPLYVFANADNGQGNEVWVAGAGLENPRLLKDINPGIQSADPAQFTALPDGRLVFVANDGVHGRELWVTDGTEGGTRMLRDIGTGDGTYGPEQLTLLPNGSILFTADNGTTGRELWLTDGTADGTRLLKDIHPGTASSDISDFTPVADGRYVFSADDGVHGKEWWVTDGTEAGTHLLKDITPGAEGTNTRFNRMEGDGTLHVEATADSYDGQDAAWDAAYGEWKTDGTTEGTVKVSDQLPLNHLLVPVDGDTWVYKAYYWAGGSDKNLIQALYATDGTPGGTRIILDHTGGIGAPGDVFSIGNGLAVVPQGGALWVTDGTAEGTRVVAESGFYGNTYDAVAIPGGRMLVTNTIRHFDGTPDTGLLWVTDGTEAGTVQLTSPQANGPASLPDAVSVLEDGTLVFSAPSLGGDQTAVWKLDLSTGNLAQETELQAWAPTTVHEVVPQDAPTTPEEPGTPDGHAGGYVFINSGPGGNELWVADSEFGERRLLKDINAGFGSSDPSDLTRLPDGRVLFVANDGPHGRELWITDGTADGTRMVRDIGTGDGTYGPEKLTLLSSGLVMFTADNGTAGRELWVTDGTAEGTHLLKDIHAGAQGSDISDFIALPDGRFLFTADDGVHGKELWSTDGTTEGTYLVKDITPGAFGTSLGLARIDGEGNAFFSVSPENGSPDWQDIYGEWKSDGTYEGTVRTSDRTPEEWVQPAGTDGNLWVYKGFYAASDQYKDFVQAVYATDGTPEGTHIILDHTGTPGATSDMFALGNGLVVFPQLQDLWVTDGTAEGTKIIGENVLVGQWADDFTLLPDGRVLFINLHDYVGGYANTSDIWVTDGTEAGTIRLSGPLASNPQSLPETASVLDDGTILLTSHGFDGNPVATWRIDAEAGTVERLQDVSPWSGETGAVAVGHDAPAEPGTPSEPGNEAAGYVFANAEGTHGNELWVSNGELGERHLLKDINPGLASADPTELTRMADGKVLFVANDGVHGRELWITDGSETGTHMLRDIGTGDGTYGPTNLTLGSDGKVYFTANDHINGSELWVTDGTSEGTQMLMNGAPGPWSSSPNAVHELSNGHIVFTAQTGTQSNELWVTDGTPEGTDVIRAVSRFEGLFPQDIALSVDGDKGLVATNKGFLITDGTAGGTTTVEMAPATDGYYAAGQHGEDRWVFARYFGDGVNLYEKSLWSTDGTAEGTVKLLDPSEQTIGGKVSGETHLAELGNGLVIFQGGEDLYATDGTREGTHVIGDDILGLHVATDFVSLGDGRALFMNRDYADSMLSPTKADLWVTDGTEAGTFRIADSQTWNAGSLPDEVNVLADGSVVFSAASMDGNPNAVWHVNMWAGGLERLDGMQNWTGEYQPTELVAFGHQDAVWG
ncbi:MAG TPA: ELWxxDGT repeat protein [Roseomonas sp.]|nr:ELWxxDGT repeat protein [Roseomonas sp.]